MKKTRKKLLIVDDAVDLIELLDQKARHLNFDCYLDLTGESCVEKATKLKPDLILLDMNLPGVNGLDLIRQLKSQQNLANIPIVVLSGVKDAAIRKQAFELGAEAYLVKGEHMEELFDVIKDKINASPQMHAAF